MTNKERILATLRGEATDTLPFIPRIDNWFYAQKANGTLPDAFKNATLQQMVDELGIGYHSIIPNFGGWRKGGYEDLHVGLGIYDLELTPWRVEFHNVGIKSERDNAGNLTVTYDTPKGKIVTRKAYTDEMIKGGATLHVIREHAIKDSDDYEAILYIFDNAEVIPEYDAYAEYQKNVVGDRGVAVALSAMWASAGHWLIKELMGYEDFYAEWMSVTISPFIRLNPEDNVIVARKDVPAGVCVEDEGFTTLTDVPAGYKVAARSIQKGEKILKYNTCIGFAAEETPAGTMMHSHNIVFDHVDLDYAYGRDYHPVELLPPHKRATFKGYVRENGEVGTRNYIAVMVAGNCAATVARRIANHFTEERLKDYPNVSGVVPFITGLGCGMEMTGPFMDLLRRTIMGYATNPNVGAALVVALGCERNNIDGMFEFTGVRESDTIRKLVIQDVGGTAKAIRKGIEQIGEMLPIVNACERQTVSVEHLRVALECGGSDGFSGLSANPALGRAVDTLVRNGGTAILSETTEIFGVEHTLTRRARTPEIGKKLTDHIEWWLKYNEGKDCQINGRVSPGNNKGGLANVLEKSLGGAKKGGETPLNEVYDYAEKVTEHGLVFMNTPGYDPVATTGQVAGGANLVAFTTGRGSCFGGVPAPVLKLASNTPMYERMEGDMDINCGVVIDGEKTLDEMGKVIFDRMIEIASGDKSKSELLGVGEDEFVPWPIGVLA